MIVPCPRASHAGMKAFIMWKCALTLRSKEKSQALSSVSMSVPAWTKPEQLNRMSGVPTRLAAASIWSCFSTSRVKVSMPDCSAASEASASALMSVAQTLAPSFAMQMADARPMPWPAEVTIAVLP